MSLATCYHPKVGDLVEHFLDKRKGESEMGVVIGTKTGSKYRSRVKYYVVFWTKSKYTDECLSYELELAGER